jgi:RNA polymerase sigma-70 factor (ECF subfamily)
LKFDIRHLEILENIPNPSRSDKNLVYKEFEANVFREIKKLPPRSQEVIILS